MESWILNDQFSHVQCIFPHDGRKSRFSFRREIVPSSPILFLPDTDTPTSSIRNLSDQ